MTGHTFILFVPAGAGILSGMTGLPGADFLPAGLYYSIEYAYSCAML